MLKNHCSRQKSSDRRAVPAAAWIAVLSLVVVNCDGHVVSQSWGPRFSRARGWPIAAVVYDWPSTRATERPSRWPPPFRYLDVTDPNRRVLVVQHVDSPRNALLRDGETHIRGEGIIVDCIFACMAVIGAFYLTCELHVLFASRGSAGLALRVAAFTTVAVTVLVFQDDVGKYLNLLSQMSHATVWCATFGFWLMTSRGIERLVFPSCVVSLRPQEEQGDKPPLEDAGPGDRK
jgi:hypothetical protein